MATAAQASLRMTPQEYYAHERLAEEKSDYFQGEIFARAGGSSRHSLICVNISGELRSRLKGSPCAVYESNQRLKIHSNGLRAYPDVSVYCGEMHYDEEDPERDTATNPRVIVEVLSESTERYDRGLKAASYRTIPSLESYLLVSQDEAHVEVYEKAEEHSWRLTEFIGLESQVELSCLDLAIPMAEIYDRLSFPERALHG